MKAREAEVATGALQRVLNAALAHVPYYRERAHRYRYDPAEPSSWLRVPLLPKEEVRAHQESVLSDRADRNRLMSQLTSGSTGVPLRIYRSAWENAAQAALLGHYRRKACPGLDESRMAEYIVMKENGRLESTPSGPKLLLSVYALEEEQVAEQFEMLNEYRPVFLQGYASALARMAQFILDRHPGHHWPELGMVENRSEHLTPEQREYMRRAFGVPVRNMYATREFWLVAYDCACDQLHLVPENACVEILDDDEQPARPGEPGEVIITGLTNLTFPLIRYRVGDVGMWAPEPCPCGNPNLVLKILHGRTREKVLTPTGELNPAAVREMFELLEHGTFAQVIQAQFRQVTMSEFEVLLVPRQNWEAPDNLDRQISEALTECLHFPVSARCQLVSRIPPDAKSGKVSSFVRLC